MPGSILASSAFVFSSASSGHSMSSFCVPSVASWWATVGPLRKVISAASSSRSALERLVIARGSATPFW